MRINHRGKVSVIIGLMAVALILSLGSSCRKVSERELLGEKRKGQRVEVQPLSGSSGDVMDSATGENEITAASTPEAELPMEVITKEARVEQEKEAYVKVRSVLYKLEKGELSPERTLKPGETVKVLQKALLRSGKFKSEAYLIRTGDGIEGYVYPDYICDRRICVEPVRWGVIKMYDPTTMAYQRVPQIKFLFTNLYEKPVEELNIKGEFFYKGEKIGEDSVFLVSRNIGMEPLKRGEGREAFLRPVFDLKEGEVLTPDNPVVVKLECSANYEKYNACGVFKIDQMHY